MVKAKRSSTSKRTKRGRPSLFFILVMLIALVLLAWGAVRVIRTPVGPDAATQSGVK